MIYPYQPYPNQIGYPLSVGDGAGINWPCPGLSWPYPVESAGSGVLVEMLKKHDPEISKLEDEIKSLERKITVKRLEKRVKDLQKQLEKLAGEC